MRAYLREVFDAMTSTSALLHLVSLSAFAVAAIVFSAGAPADRPDPDGDQPAVEQVAEQTAEQTAGPNDPVVRVTLFGNVVGEIGLPRAE